MSTDAVKRFRILTMCGSLRGASSNAAILRLASRTAPEDIEVVSAPPLDALPYFNPDLDRDLDDPRLPDAVRALRAALATSDALLISSPEYAHGISGMLKNALDWLVGGPEMVERRVGVINTSPHATHANAALLETLRTMSAHLVAGACVALAVPRGMPDDKLAQHAELMTQLRAALYALANEVR